VAPTNDQGPGAQSQGLDLAVQTTLAGHGPLHYYFFAASPFRACGFLSPFLGLLSLSTFGG